jgi:hypothetical protein
MSLLVSDMGLLLDQRIMLGRKYEHLRLSYRRRWYRLREYQAAMHWIDKSWC